MTYDTNSVSGQLADVYSSTSFDDLSPAVVNDTRRAILDWLGSALAGSLEPPAVMTRAVVATLGDTAFFTFSSPTEGLELWSSTGCGTPALVQDLVNYVQGAGYWLDADRKNRTRAAGIAADRKYFNQDPAAWS